MQVWIAKRLFSCQGHRVVAPQRENKWLQGSDRIQVGSQESPHSNRKQQSHWLIEGETGTKCQQFLNVTFEKKGNKWFRLCWQREFLAFLPTGLKLYRVKRKVLLNTNKLQYISDQKRWVNVIYDVNDRHLLIRKLNNWRIGSVNCKISLLRPLHTHLYVKISKFLHTNVPECTLRAVILEGSPNVHVLECHGYSRQIRTNKEGGECLSRVLGAFPQVWFHLKMSDSRRQNKFNFHCNCSKWEQTGFMVLNFKSNFKTDEAIGLLAPLGRALFGKWNAQANISELMLVCVMNGWKDR